MSSTRPTAPEPLSRRQQFAQAYTLARRTDSRLPLWIAGAFLAGGLVGFGVFWVIVGHKSTLGLVLSAIGGVMLGVLAALVIFSRRAQKAAYQQMEGQVGAAAGALGLLKRGWHVDTAVAFNKQQDVVHRVVGAPGIVLVGEGSSASRLKGLLNSERRRHERVATDTPVHEIVCGPGEGQVPLPKLARHIQKMKRQVSPAEITDILARLKAIDASRPSVPMPKGPVPTSMKGMRGNMRGR